MKKVLFFITQLCVGGAERQLHLLCNLLMSRGWRCAVVSNVGGFWEERFRADGVPVMTLRDAPKTRLPFDAAKLLKFAPDVIVMWSPSAPGAIYSRTVGAGKPVIYYEQADGRTTISLMRRPNVAFVRNLAVLTANSQAAMDFLRREKVFKPSPLERVIENGVEIPDKTLPRWRSTIRSDAKIPEGAQVVATVGNIRAEKNFSMFLRVAQKTRELSPEVVFLHVGRPTMSPAERALYESLPVGLVVMAGERSDAMAACGEVDAFILTSSSEGMPNALLEAMAWGAPCVSTRVGQVDKIIDDCVNSYLVDIDDADAMAKRLCGLLKNKREAAEIGAKAKASVLRRYGPDLLVDSFITLFEESLKTKRKT